MSLLFLPTRSMHGTTTHRLWSAPRERARPHFPPLLSTSHGALRYIFLDFLRRGQAQLWRVSSARHGSHPGTVGASMHLARLASYEDSPSAAGTHHPWGPSRRRPHRQRRTQRRFQYEKHTLRQPKPRRPIATKTGAGEAAPNDLRLLPRGSGACQQGLRMNLRLRGSFNKVPQKSSQRGLPHVAVKWSPNGVFFFFHRVQERWWWKKRLPMGLRFWRAKKRTIENMFHVLKKKTNHV